MNLEKFEYKNILITGASSGIGEAMALLLARSSANLYLTGKNWENRVEVSEMYAKTRAFGIDKTYGNTYLFEVDFSDSNSIDALISVITKEKIAFNYLILNAGVSQRALTLETAFSVDRTIMEINFFGPVYFIKKLSGLLLSGKPVHIAVTTSISGLFGFPLRSAYCASKHALFGFFESLELENSHIKVTFLIPGRISTPISKSALLADGTPYAKMDSGQSKGMDVNKCARIALRAIRKEKRRRLIGGKELLMVYLKKFIPFLFYLLARKISVT